MNEGNQIEIKIKSDSVSVFKIKNQFSRYKNFKVTIELQDTIEGENINIQNRSFVFCYFFHFMGPCKEYPPIKI